MTRVNAHKRLNPVTDSPPKARRGFACMTQERRAEIARMGGKSVPAEKRSFSRDRSLAETAGRKGGEGGAGKRKKPAT